MRKYIALLIFLLLFPVLVLAGGDQVPSGVTAQQLLTDARGYLREPTASFYSDDQLLRWLNNAVLDVTARTKCIHTGEGIKLVSGQSEYAVVLTYLSYENVVFESHTKTAPSGASYFKGLIRGTQNNIGHTEDVLEPVYWYDFKGLIGVYPVPGSDAAGSTIYVAGVSKPPALDLTDSLTLPMIYEAPLVWYVAAQALYRNRLFNEANVLMTQYYQTIAQFREEIVNPPKEALEDQIRR